MSTLKNVFKTTFFNQRLVIRIEKGTYFIDEVSYFKNGCELPERVLKVLEKKEESGIYFPIHLEMIRYHKCKNDVRSSSEIIFEDWDVSSEIDSTIFSEEYMTRAL